MQRISFGFAIAACVAGTLAGAPELRAESAADFYANRQMTMLIGTTVGGGYDLFGRMIARHMGRHLPGGSARFIVRNMPGAGGLIAANHVFNVAERDGSVIATVTRETIFDPLLSGDTQSRFDARRFLWLGSPNLEVGMIYVSAAIGIEAFEQARQREVKLGSSGASRSVNAILPKLLNELIGTKFKVISGIPDRWT
jgi:tripartite-type tricarboxylate transporter receptor subunit TctC